MRDKKNILRVQQLLFGYDRGHSLLASSSPAAKGLSNEVLSDTDWDPRAKPSVSSYLTGYPLPTRKTYVLMKTWRAPEMPRPGCVWTHVLLIDDADLSRVSELKILAAYLRKPTKIGDYSKYNKEIEIDLSSTDRTVSKLKPRIVDSLINLTYGSDSDIAVEADMDDVEDSMLALWSQQWPALRRRFSFRLISPYSNAPNSSSRFNIELSRPNSSRQTHLDSAEENALGVIAKEISANRPNGLRRFLWRYGADTKSEPIDLVRLSHLYDQLFSSDLNSHSLRTIVKQVGSWFPNLSDANLFKSDLTRPASAKYSLLPQIDQLQVAQMIFEKRSADVFPDLGPVAKITIDTWIDSRPLEFSRLLSATANDVGSFSDSLFVGIDPQKHGSFLWSLLPKSETTFVRAVGSSIDCLADDRISNVSDDALLRLVGNAVASAPSVKKIVPYIMSRDSAELISAVFEHAGPTVTSAVIQRLALASSASGVSIDDNWIECVRDHPDQIVEFARHDASKRSQLLVCRYLLNADTRTFPLSVWTERLEKIDDDLTGEVGLEFKVFLLVQTMKHPEIEALVILRDSFDAVNDALASRQLPFRTEMQLTEHLPHIGWFNNWDKCLRLKIAAVAIGKSFKLSKKDILSITKRQHIKDELSDIWKS